MMKERVSTVACFVIMAIVGIQNVGASLKGQVHDGQNCCTCYKANDVDAEVDCTETDAPKILHRCSAVSTDNHDSGCDIRDDDSKAEHYIGNTQIHM